MKCPKCNKVIKKTDKNCRFCGVEFENNKEKTIIKTQIIYKTIENKANKWLILIIGVLSFLIILESSFMIWYFFINKPIIDNKKIIEDYNYKEILPYEIYNTNEQFEFDNLKISILDKFEIFKLDNTYSIYNGKNIIKIPISITNISDTNHGLNLFYYDIFDDTGNSIDEVAGYYEESLYYAEDLKKDSSYTKYIYALYFGNDSYIIRLKNKEKEIFVKYNIKNLTN